MRRFLALSLFIGCTCVVSASPSENTTLEQQAASLALRFVGELKPQLKQSMAAGGPTLAIEVCATVAPRIADTLSAESGWRVKRVSLKSRNASRAQPDKWERGVLEEFDKRQIAGEPATTINYGATTGNQYRYMQAQGVDEVCLVCHGENLTEPVRAALQMYYPDDWATGYSLGQVRGAISLSKNL